MDDEVHIASFMVQHRTDAVAALEHISQSWPGLEIAAREETRSILLHEGASSKALLECMDAVQAVPGVIAVNLVYHHVEQRTALDDAM